MTVEYRTTEVEAIFKAADAWIKTIESIHQIRGNLFMLDEPIHLNL